jgi:hypothetical protein
MRILFTISICILSLLIIAPTCHKNIREDENSLSKYSYFFYGFTDECKVINVVYLCRTITGTGFLVRINGSIYLLSAAHSFFDLKHFGEEPKKYTYPTKFYLRLYRENSHNPDTISFDVSRLHPPEDYFYNHADVFWFKINIPDKYQIYSIENLLTENPKDFKKSKKGIMYGYPHIDTFDFSRQPIKSTFDASTYLDSISMTENKNESDPGLKQLDGYAAEGNSGSPLFLILNNSKIIFGGLCIAINDNKVIFVRPKDVIKEMPNK